MHILLIHQFFLNDHDGGGSRWNEISRIWIERGHQVTVLAGTVHYMNADQVLVSRQNFSAQTNQHGVRVIRCYVSGAYHTGFAGKLWAYLSFMISSIWAGVFITKDKFNLIVVTSPPLFVGVTALVLSWFKGIPFVFEVRDLWPESAMDTDVLKNKWFIALAFRFEKHIYSKALIICVLTPAFRDILLLKKHVPAEKIIYIPNGADFRFTDEAQGHFDVPAFRRKNNLEGKFVVIYVGAHGFANNLIQIINTAERVRDIDVCFLMVGNGKEKPWLMEESIKRGLSNISFVEQVPKSEVFKYIIASDIGVSILRNVEIFKTIYSNKTFDYFACKKPVLMSIDGISRKLVEEADAGIFIEPENPDDFAEKIRYCYGRPDMLRIQGENGYCHAKEFFDREVWAKRYLDLIEQLNSEQVSERKSRTTGFLIKRNP